MPSLLRIGDLTKREIVAILDRAEELRGGWPSKFEAVGNPVVGLFFFQPSTRTRVGFQAAVARLGGTAVVISEPKREASMTAAETLEDALRSVGMYFDLVVMRHGDEDSVDRIANLYHGPLINAGNGVDEHPSQALIDLFAIRARQGKLEGLSVGVVGDLARSRAAHSLVRVLRHFPPARLRLMHPEGGELPEDRLAGLDESTQVEVIQAVDVSGLDVLYVAGLPRGVSELVFDEQVRLRYRISRHQVKSMSSNGQVLCPLPRIDEIDQEVDDHVAAGYFEQSQLGQFVRVALLDWALADSENSRYDIE